MSLTKISGAILDRIKPDFAKALQGTWGIIGNVIFMGRVNMQFIYEGTIIKHDGDVKGIAVIVYTDDDWAIKSLEPNSVTTLEKEIKTGIVVSQQRI